MNTEETGIKTNVRSLDDVFGGEVATPTLETDSKETPTLKQGDGQSIDQIVGTNPELEKGDKPLSKDEIKELIQEKRENRASKDAKIADLEAKIAELSNRTTPDPTSEEAKELVLKDLGIDPEDLKEILQERKQEKETQQVNKVEKATRSELERYLKDNPDSREIINEDHIVKLVKLSPEYRGMKIEAIIEDFYGSALNKVKANLSYQTKAANAPEKPDFKNLSKKDYQEMETNTTLKQEYRADLNARIRASGLL